jgi:hypothetical protein
MPLARQLDMLLEGPQASLLPEMLNALAQTGHRVPEFLLPSLLEKGKRLVRSRETILPALGNRGRWLAGQNSDWGYASLAIDTWEGLWDEWETAMPSQRQALLRQLRTTHPERGRQILEQSWRTNNSLVRHQIIKILDVNLTLADEPFLEAALDDRSHLVRQAAADLLARLPDSRLAQRMVQHLAGVLSWTPPTAKEQKIIIRLPKEITPDLMRDGIPVIKTEDRAKLQSRLLTQIVSRVPLRHWIGTWQKTPVEIVQAALGSSWPRTLTSAFSTAAIRQNEAAWAEALIVANQFSPANGRLVPILSADTCFALMQQAAQQSPLLLRPHPLHIFLQHWPHSWTTPMGEFWLALFRQHLLADDEQSPDPSIHNLFKRFGQKCTPELADTAVTQLTTIPGLSSIWQKTVNHLCQTLQLRRTLLAQIHSLGLQPLDPETRRT